MSDFSELDKLSADIARAVEVAAPRVSGSTPFLEKAVEVAAFELKKGWVAKAKAASGKRLKRYPYSIDYEMLPTKRREVSAVVGPNPAKAQGRFGAAEDATGGWRRLGARPQHARDEPTAKARESLKRGVRIAIDDALRKANL